MSMVAVNWSPSDRHLRQFSLTALVALPLLGWLWHASGAAWLVIVSLGAAMALTGLLCPRALRYPYLGLSLLTLPIGLVVGELVLLLSFYAVFVPVGLARRLMGRDDLHRSFDRRSSTYWQPKRQPADRRSYLRQS
jgi:hypothetical protein